MSLILRFMPPGCTGQKHLSYFKQAMLCSTASTYTASASGLSGMTQTASSLTPFPQTTPLPRTDTVLLEAVQRPGRAARAAHQHHTREHVASESSLVVKRKQRRNVSCSASLKLLSGLSRKERRRGGGRHNSLAINGI